MNGRDSVIERFWLNNLAAMSVLAEFNGTDSYEADPERILPSFLSLNFSPTTIDYINVISEESLKTELLSKVDFLTF